jgi:hypothetical protein
MRQFGNLEFRADMDEQLKWNPLARLGFEPDQSVVGRPRYNSPDIHEGIRYPYYAEQEYIDETLPGAASGVEYRDVAGRVKPGSVVVNSNTAKNPVWSHEYTHGGIEKVIEYLNEDREFFTEKYGKDTVKLLDAIQTDTDRTKGPNEKLTEMLDDVSKDAEVDIHGHLIPAAGTGLGGMDSTRTAVEDVSSRASLQEYLKKGRVSDNLSGKASFEASFPGYSGIFKAAEDMLEKQGEPLPSEKRGWWERKTRQWLSGGGLFSEGGDVASQTREALLDSQRDERKLGAGLTSLEFEADMMPLLKKDPIAMLGYKASRPNRRSPSIRKLTNKQPPLYYDWRQDPIGPNYNSRQDKVGYGRDYGSSKDIILHELRHRGLKILEDKYKEKDSFISDYGDTAYQLLTMADINGSKSNEFVTELYDNPDATYIKPGDNGSKNTIGYVSDSLEFVDPNSDTQAMPDLADELLGITLSSEDHSQFRSLVDNTAISKEEIARGKSGLDKAARDLLTEIGVLGFNEGGDVASQTEEALGWTAEGKKFADENPVEVTEEKPSALSIADVPVFDRPMDASESDRWTGVQDELGNREYITIFGRKYFVRLADDQRTNYEKIQQDIIPAVKNYLDNPTAPSREQTIDFLKQSLGAAWETFKIPGDLAAGNKGMEDVTLGNIFELAGGTGAASTVGKVPGGDSSNTMRIFGGAKASNPPNVRDPGGIETYFSAEADSKTLENLSIDFENDPTGSMVRMMDAIEADPKKYPNTLKQVVQGKWFRGRDDLMRFEIDDSDSKIVGGGVSNLINMNQDDMDAYLNDSMFSVYKKFPDTSIQDMPGEKAFTTLEDVLDHPRLYDQYPELKNAPVIVDVGYFKKNPQVEGYFDPSSGTIAINTKKITSNSELRETLIHEVQHLIQHLEGFESGTSLRNQDVLKIKKAIEGSPEYQKVLENYNTEVSDYLKNRDLATTDLYNKNKEVAFKILDIILDDFSKNTEIPVEKLYERISKGETFESIKMSVPFSVSAGSRGLIYSPDFDQVLDIAQGNVGSMSPSSSINLNRSLDNVNPKESAVPYFNLLSEGDKIDLISDNNRWHQKKLASVVNSLIKHNSELSKDFKKSLGFSAEDFIYAGRSGPNLISKLYGIPHIVPPTKPKVVRNYVIYSTKRGEVEARNASARMDMLASERTPENVFIKEDTSAQDQWGEPELEKVEKGINPIKNYGPNNSQLEPRFAQGGVVNDMNNQMEMIFNEGGIADDGMRRDPVSGNEIPPGSLAEEVRDDIPAQLSEGEYVVPADVVRFFGVKYFEDLRMEAKMGLSNMEANGRIGGEPIEPSGMEENPLTPEEMAVLEQMTMAVGGFVPDQEPPQAIGNSAKGFALGGEVDATNYQSPVAGLPPLASIPGASYMNEGWRASNIDNYQPVQTIEAETPAPTTTAPVAPVSAPTTGKQACEAMGMMFDETTQQCVLRQSSKDGNTPSSTGYTPPESEQPVFKWEEPEVNYFSMSDKDLAKVGMVDETDREFRNKTAQGASVLFGIPILSAAFGLFDSHSQNNAISNTRAAALVAAARGNETLAETLNKRAQEMVGKSSYLTQAADYFGALSGVNEFAQQVKFKMPKDMEFDPSKLGLTENQQKRVLEAVADRSESQPPIVKKKGSSKKPAASATYTQTSSPNAAAAAASLRKRMSDSGNADQMRSIKRAADIAQEAADTNRTIAEVGRSRAPSTAAPTASDIAASRAGATRGAGGQFGMNKGGLIKKRKKK